MSNTVVWYDSAETGAPTLNNTAGSLDAVLNACLVTGFRVLTLDSVTVTANVATVTVASGHGYGNDRVVELAGAATGSINGRKLITVTNASTFTFPAPGVADGAVAGTITAKRAPLGWARPLSAGNVSIYARTDVTATGMALRIDDSGSTAARVLGVESYGGDVSTYGATFPTSAQVSGGAWWSKGANTAAAKRWFLIGDSRTFYLLTDNGTYPASSNGNSLFAPYGFGDINSWRSGDAYACMLAGGTTEAQGNGLVGNGLGMWLARVSSGLGDAVISIAVLHARATYQMGRGAQTYPSPVDNGMPIVHSVPCTETNSVFGNPLRGTLRGIGDPICDLGTADARAEFAFGKRLSNVVGVRTEWWVQTFQHAASQGALAFDMQGPW